MAARAPSAVRGDLATSTMEHAYVLCEVSWVKSLTGRHGVEFFAKVHSRFTANASDAKRQLQAVRGDSCKLTLVREEKMGRYTLLSPLNNTPSRQLTSDSPNDGQSLEARLAVVTTSTDGYLNLRSNSTFPSLRASDLYTVLRAFASSASHAQLGLTGNSALGTEGAARIADAISSGELGHVAGLYLSNCDFGSEGGRIADALLVPTGCVCGVARLGLNFNQLGDAAVIRSVAPLLCGSALRSLQVLGLSGNLIGDAGAAALATALASNVTLHRLFLSSNQIGDAGAQAMALLMSTSGTLRRVGLAFNLIQSAGGHAVASGAEAGALHRLERVCMFGNPVLEEEEEAMETRKAEEVHLEAKEQEVTGGGGHRAKPMAQPVLSRPEGQDARLSARQRLVRLPNVECRHCRITPRSRTGGGASEL